MSEGATQRSPLEVVEPKPPSLPREGTSEMQDTKPDPPDQPPPETWMIGPANADEFPRMVRALLAHLPDRERDEKWQLVRESLELTTTSPSGLSSCGLSSSSSPASRSDIETAPLSRIAETDVQANYPPTKPPASLNNADRPAGDAPSPDSATHGPSSDTATGGSACLQPDSIYNYWSGMFVARTTADHRPIAVVWAHPAPGATALVGTPRALESVDDEWRTGAEPPETPIQVALLQATIEWAEQVARRFRSASSGNDCRDAQSLKEAKPDTKILSSAPNPLELMQAVADYDDTEAHQAFVSAGFQKLVDLVFVMSPELEVPAHDSVEEPLTVNRPPAPQDSSANQSAAQDSAANLEQTAEVSNSHPILFENVLPYPNQVTRWGCLLEQTYTDSRDCPAISGQRKIEHTIAGYWETGTRWEHGWQLLRAQPTATSGGSGSPGAIAEEPLGHGPQAQDLGCLVLADHPESDFVELVYFGLVPAARGQGLGGRLLAKAELLARQQGRRRLIAAVDRQNLPALRLYAARGYIAIDQKSIFARFFGQSKAE
jgi:GNAT superfamily N-acetyltransferase